MLLEKIMDEKFLLAVVAAGSAVGGGAYNSVIYSP